jgi:hypothetical protein
VLPGPAVVDDDVELVLLLVEDVEVVPSAHELVARVHFFDVADQMYLHVPEQVDKGGAAVVVVVVVVESLVAIHPLASWSITSMPTSCGIDHTRV